MHLKILATKFPLWKFQACNGHKHYSVKQKLKHIHARGIATKISSLTNLNTSSNLDIFLFSLLVTLENKGKVPSFHQV